ncbi:zinc-binding dehydrogenase [Nocardia otitidiscaviarum]|uniref:Zinc-binding dehydrogenase n=1 Tax=Nocardia otitidiscaviarum TaxID=1823 RepID=A0A516NMU5_9NOCA|nr:zinc-binding dehydrogenase [Nocardia otitidiscaviarum]MCP9624535.1 zinc-binding dehydrogenase [Nocardia otitidiscaviarum]QDP80218.1 zinc-binding dehydrogenase [Nocardia otitidiscaviarum]
MQAIVMTATGGPEVLVARELPAPRPRRSEVLIRTEAIPVLFPETLLRAGVFPMPAAPPLIFGTQAAGVVVEAGADLDTALVGRRVLAACEGFGTYAELVCAPADSIVELPENLSATDAAAVGMSGSVALPLLETARLTGTETVLIEAAATGVGGYLTQLAKEFGAARVIATAGGPVKLARARELGADEVVDHSDPEWTRHLREVVGETTVDVVFDAIGGESATALLDLMTPLRGRMLSYGWLSGAPAQVHAADLLSRGLTLIGCAGPEWLARVGAARPAVLHRAASGSLSALTDRVLPLDRAADAHRLIAERRPLGTIVLRPDAREE